MSDYERHKLRLITTLEFVSLRRIDATEFSDFINEEFFSQGYDFDYIRKILLDFDRTKNIADELIELIKELCFDTSIKIH